MFTYTSNGVMKLNRDTAQEILDKVLKRSTPVLEAGTPEEIHHITSALKDVLEIMSTKEEEK